ncbi:MAG: hypothetical protein R3B99_14790 [Polyangiales bacterium]
MHTLAVTEGVDPTEAHRFDRRAFRLGADERGVPGAVGLAEGVAAGDERDRLFVVHRHAREGLAHVASRLHRIGLAVRTLGVHVDEAHLHGAERVGELAVAAVAFVAEPRRLGAPIDVLLGLPDVLAPARETEGRKAHRLERDVAREDHQVGPRELVPVLLLDRPEQPARLVEVAVVGPAVERRETLRARAGAAASVADAVGAGAVPRHADEESAVVPPIGRPPRLRVGHEREQVGFDRRQVERTKRIRVREPGAQRVSGGRVLVEDREVQLIGPPIAIRLRRVGRGMHRTLSFVAHRIPPGVTTVPRRVPPSFEWRQARPARPYAHDSLPMAGSFE